MNILKLSKQNEPKFDELSEMILSLKDFLAEEVNFNDKLWAKNLNTIIDFQDDDGSFKLFNSNRIPSDARVDFIYTPTYLCTAILMKAFITDSDAFTIREKSALFEGLRLSCARNLRGHGYEAFKGQIEALNIFMKAGLREFIDIHYDFCQEFSEMIEKIITQFRERISGGKFTGSWDESYEDEIRQINEYFSTRNVFVYGTLMDGETNHHYLDNSKYHGKAFIEGYEMYDVGWYPAIVPGDRIIIGELYTVPLNDMPSIDMLEGEGRLYLKKCETVMDSEANRTLAFVYVYLGDVEHLERISSWREEYVWYVSYGSNMLKERFMCYIKGGSFEGSRYHPPCDDTTPPVAVKAIEIPYSMYFGHTSGSWHGSGVSFLDVTEPGKALGVAYLITKKQFEHVCLRENSGREPQQGYSWYEDIIELGEIGGFEVKTITNKNLRQYNPPYPEYRNILRRGLLQNWPEMDNDEIYDYLNDCIR